MKKAFITLCVIVMTTATVFAAGGKGKPAPTRYYLPSFTEGWFFDAAGTYSIFAGTGTSYKFWNTGMSTWYGNWPAGTNVRPNNEPFWGGSLKLGKRMTQSLSLRIGYDLHKSGNKEKAFRFKNLHFDVMESPLDLFLGYNPERLFTLWVYGGMGILACDQQQTWFFDPRNSNFELGFHGGFVNAFRLSNSFDLHIDFTGTATRWSFDSDHPDTNPNATTIHNFFHRMHYDFTAEAGLTWYIGGRRFETVVPEVQDCSKQDARIRELTNQIKNLEDQLGITINTENGQIVEAGNITIHDTIVQYVNTGGETVVVTYPFSVFFNKGAYELRDGRDRINLQEVANAAVKHGLKVNLRGTCDSATASAAFNKTLAEKRCNKVKDELVKMGVPAGNITIDAVGGVNELKPAEYDRRVMIQLSK
jgi:outer membrane protein OmpA-like peptidoglycan-associated protein